MKNLKEKEISNKQSHTIEDSGSNISQGDHIVPGNDHDANDSSLSEDDNIVESLTDYKIEAFDAPLSTELKDVHDQTNNLWKLPKMGKGA
eukprot:12813255-Ditylum_brightwellii.AAC.1